jgi:hypothetical protein
VWVVTTWREKIGLFFGGIALFVVVVLGFGALMALVALLD